MEKITQFARNGDPRIETETSPILKAILEELDSISKSVSKNVDKTPSGQQKEVSPISANPLFSLVPKGGFEPPQGLLPTRP